MLIVRTSWRESKRRKFNPQESIHDEMVGVGIEMCREGHKITIKISNYSSKARSFTKRTPRILFCVPSIYLFYVTMYVEPFSHTRSIKSSYNKDLRTFLKSWGSTTATATTTTGRGSASTTAASRRPSTTSTTSGTSTRWGTISFYTTP